MHVQQIIYGIASYIACLKLIACHHTVYVVNACALAFQYLHALGIKNLVTRNIKNQRFQNSK